MMLYCLRKPCRHLPPAFLVSNIMATHYTIMLLKEVFQQIIQRLSWEWNTKVVPWVGVCQWLTAQITTRKPLRCIHLNMLLSSCLQGIVRHIILLRIGDRWLYIS